jgi:hypothetical protein
MLIPKWAQEIDADKQDDVILVAGKGHYPFPGFSASYRADQNNERWMHIDFANADTDSELLDFVGRHGPVNGRTLGGELFDVAGHSHAFKSLTVEQPIQKLREAHSAIAPAVRLIATLQAENPVTFETVHGLCCMVGTHIGVSHEDVSGFDMSGTCSKKTMGLATRRELSLAADYLCELLNRVPPKLASVGQRAVELPYYNEDGILPILYYLLRQDFLSAVRTIGICARCRRLFAVTRRGSQFCSAECSQLKRALDYYHEKRADRRKR